MIKISHVNKQYVLDADNIFHALTDVSIEIKDKEFVSIIGQSGSGKSTLMHIIGLLDKPTSGQVIVNDQDVSKLDDDKISLLRNDFVGFVFQQFNLINKLTVLENVMLPSIYSRKKLDFNPLEKANELLKRFGLEEKIKSYPNKLSGGQQQRVAIARALIMGPKLILADEPTGNLDSKSGEIVLSLIRDLNHKEKITVIVVTHDMNVAKQAGRIIKIKDGKIEK
ncbi:MAG: ABC transporter ATP-binding protein [Patescibacteria group bacterium]|jgi:ABC-type lipoprotein export system ATPase subunit